MAMMSSRKSYLKAAATGDMEELNYCLAHRVPGSWDIDVRGKEGLTALWLAATGGQTAALKALIDAGADIEAPGADGMTPLLGAVRAGRTAAARLLIAAGADVHAHDHNYVTPIITAARDGDLDVVRDLLAAGADANAVSKATGRTGLHWAVANGHGPVVELLVAHKARTDIADRDGKCAPDLAQAQPRILQMLQAPRVEKAAPPSPLETGQDDAAESWALFGTSAVARVTTSTPLNRRLTEIFNFESRERLIISENLKTGAESVTPPAKFDELPEALIARAAEEMKRLGSGGERPARRTFTL